MKLDPNTDYKTRDGRMATVLNFDGGEDFPVIAQIHEPVKGGSPTETYQRNGSWNGVSDEPLDLVEAA